MLPVILVSASLYTCFLTCDSCLFSPIPEFCFLVSCVFLFSCWIFCSLLFRFFVTPPPCSTQSMCVSFGLFHVKCYSDFQASTLIFVLSVSGSPLHLTCPVFDPCLCLTLISACSLNKFLFHSHFPVHLGLSPHIPFMVRNRQITHLTLEGVFVVFVVPV